MIVMLIGFRARQLRDLQSAGASSVPTAEHGAPEFVPGLDHSSRDG